MRRVLALLLSALLATTGLVILNAGPALAATPPDGTYLLINDRSDKCLDQDWSAGSDHHTVLAWTCGFDSDGTPSDNQLWRKLGGDYFVLENVKSGWCLNQDYSGGTARHTVLAWGATNCLGDNEHWLVRIDTGRNAFNLANLKSGWCLDQDWSGGIPHSTILAWGCKSASELENGNPNNQLWYFQRIS